jgi:hypothetical protein
MNEPNIQHLFKSISLDQIRKYLTGLGWQETVTEVRRQFEKLDPETQSMRALILPLQESHPRFRSLIPNIVFSLAVEHQREAMEIALEISKIQVSEPNPQSSTSPPASIAQAPPRPCQMEITNTGSDSIQLILSGERPISLAPREAVFLAVLPGSQPLAFETQTDLKLDTANHTVVGQSLGFPSDSPTLDNTQSMADHLLASFDQWSTSQPAGEPLLAELMGLADRYLFSIDGIGSNPPDPNGLLRGVAVLLVSISKKLERSPESATQMFRFCRTLLRPFRYTFPINPLLPDQLWITLCEDDTGAPRNSVQILQRSVVRW